MPPDDDPQLHDRHPKPRELIKQQQKPKDQGPKHKYGEDRR